MIHSYQSGPVNSISKYTLTVSSAQLSFLPLNLSNVHICMRVESKYWIRFNFIVIANSTSVNAT